MVKKCKHCGRGKPLLNITGCCRDWRDCKKNWKPDLVFKNYNNNARKMGWPLVHEIIKGSALW